MRKGHAVLTAVGVMVMVMVMVRGYAHAEPHGPPPGPTSNADPLNLRQAQLGARGTGQAARARMKADDCRGALDLFDEALRTSTEPSLFRDRGLCHEKLEQPYPAIDDYRRYLTSAPDAADADSIRERLGLLEDKVGGRVHSSEDDDSPFARSAEPVPVAVNRRNSGPLAAPTGQPSTKVDAYEEEDEDELHSVLRQGKGWSLAPFFAEHKWFFDGTSFSEGDTWAECIGVQIRYSHSRTGTLLLEAGYEHFNATSRNTTVAFGMTSLAGYEFRFQLDPRSDNQLFLMPGIGYEQIQMTPNVPTLATTSEGAVTGRLRLGYRHLLGASVAFEVSLDGGGGEFFLFDGSSGSSSSGMAGLNVAVAWGL